MRNFWKHSFGNTKLEFHGIPFHQYKTGHIAYDCQHRNHYYKQREKQTKRLCLQATKKIGCTAHMVVEEYHLYPDYQLTEKEGPFMKGHR